MDLTFEILLEFPQFCHGILESFLVVLVHSFHTDQGVTFVQIFPTTAPAEELTIIFTKAIELLFVFLTHHVMILLFHPLDHISYGFQLHVGPEVL